MLEVKGTAVLTVGKFVRERFGEEAHRKWLESLPVASRAILGGLVMPSIWYPAGLALVQPTEHACRLFFGGDLKGAWECGRFSAEDGLKGVYKIFLVVGTPSFIIKKASTILSQLYRPSEISVVGLEAKSVTLHITRFAEPHPVLDNRIGGWMERALEISGCKGVEVKIPRSLTRGDAFTEFVIGWA